MTQRFIMILSLMLFASTNVLADLDTPTIQWHKNSQSRTAPVDNEQYANSCGSCHEAYPAGLLPPQSWETIVFGVNEHFGKEVKLTKNETKEILKYLLGNAAGRSQYVLSHRMITNVKDNQLIRITELPFFVSKHKELTSNLSNCSECHTQAATGSFDSKEVKKP